MINISQVKKSEKRSKYRTQVLKDGMEKGKSKRLKQLEITDFIHKVPSTSSLVSKKRKRENTSVMQELVVPNKEETLKDKFKTSKKSIQTTRSSKTLVQGSIGKERVLQKWWNKSSMEISKKLWLPTKIDSVELDLNSLNKSVKGLTQKSWFSVKAIKKKIKTSLKTSYPLLQSLQQGIIEEEVLKRKEKEKPKKKKQKLKKEKKLQANKCLKIKLYPNKEEKETLKKWIGTTRWTYNQALNGINNLGLEINKKQLRKHCIVQDSKLLKQNKWVTQTPNDTRDEAIRDLLKAYKTCFSVGRKFKMKFKSKKQNNQSIVIHSREYGRKRGNFKFISRMKSAEKLPEKIEYDSRIVKDQLNQFWFHIPIRGEKKDNKRTENQGPFKVISLDPGVRTFMTGYGTDEVGFEWGKSDMGKIYRMGLCCDNIQSRWTKVNHSKRYRMRKAFRRIHYKIKNLVKDLHYKLAKYLCMNYDLILIPEFQTQQMSLKGKRNISSKNVRKMMTLSHYMFRQRLLHKANEYNVHVKVVTEEYTSKTCGCCGKLNKTLGPSKVFHCGSCDVKMDRDYNGARNILIKTIAQES